MVKELRLGRVPEWKTVELFEREQKTLDALDHPRIPDFVDAFHLEDDEEDAFGFYVVQEYVEGPTLAELIEQGKAFDEEQALDLLESLLEVLAYLHALNPPIVHRDIKPANLVVPAEGEVVLVDFGVVQRVLPDELGGSTVVGTTGYLPPEQLMGRAQPASDVYAAGATMVHLLSGRHPADIIMRRNRLIFHQLIDVERPFRQFLDRMLEPAAEDRFASGEEALDCLRRLRGGEADALQLPATTGRFDWLSRRKQTALVDNRATPKLTYEFRSEQPGRIGEELERRSHEVQLELTPQAALMRYGASSPAVPIRYVITGWVLVVVTVLVVPMALPAKIGLAVLLTGLAAAIVWTLDQPIERRLELTPMSYRIEADDSVRAEGDFDDFEGLELTDDGRLLAHHADETTQIASGLNPEQAEWLTARLEESAGQLRMHGKLLDVE